MSDCTVRSQAMENGIRSFMQAVGMQFENRTVVESKKQGRQNDLGLVFSIDESTLWMNFYNSEEAHSVSIPLPFERNGVELIIQNEVERALCKFLFADRMRTLDYMAIMHYIMCDKPMGIVRGQKKKTPPFIQKVINAFHRGNASTIIYNLQRAINEVVNRMPLHETDLNSWVMNHRLIIIDENFEAIQDPRERLQYQIDKSKALFHYGWTQLGLSDGTLADRNYTLTTDIRRLTPFGLRYHNPGRNLFSTLGMKGDEYPLVRSQSAKELADKGISRKGWNFNTLFADVPENFEDQILVDRRHANKAVEYTKRFQIYGQPMVKEGQVIKFGHKLGVSPDNEPDYFRIHCDRAVVTKVVKAVINVGGVPTEVYNIIVTYHRKFRDGLKLTNMHGNKGVIRLFDLGYAIDPRNGEQVPIDVIVSAKSIRKRRNYGQLMEAMWNNVSGSQESVVPDDISFSLEDVRTALRNAGFPDDGTWMADTYVGELHGVFGKVFWGCIKTAEDMLWDHEQTIRTNGKDLRTAGLKFSTVEMRALETRFGIDNPLISEVMSYAQGTENLHEQLTIMRCKTGECPTDLPVLGMHQVRPVDQTTGTIVPRPAIDGSVVDEDFMPTGFILQLPVYYQVVLDEEGKLVHEGAPQIEFQQNPGGCRVINVDKLYIPSATLRRPWRHATGKYGLSEIGVLVNNLVVMGRRYLMNTEEPFNYKMLMWAISSYLNKVSDMMATKRGDVSVYGMSVRYPSSAKAVATLSTTLPRNTIEIHRNMARELGVTTGDVVIVERFPCLGFMSVRPQKVRVTDDPMCKYTIRVSGNSLVSLSLDFDGDVLFIASFHNPDSKLLLQREHKNPNQACYPVIKELNKKAGAPHIKCMALEDYHVSLFSDLTAEEHAEYVARLTGVKAQTGPVIALAYNIMRVIENSGLEKSQSLNVAVEVFLDKVGNSVFAQKHGSRSLAEIVTEAICCGDIETLVKEGFDRSTTTTIIDVVRQKAAKLGVNDLASYHHWATEKGRSNIINRIVRIENRIYYASRANLECCEFLKCLESDVVDVPSKILKWTLSGKAAKMRNPMEDQMMEKIMSKERISMTDNREACKTLCETIDAILTGRPSKSFEDTVQERIDKAGVRRAAPVTCRRNV